MFYLILFYWVVCGLTFWALPGQSNTYRLYPISDFILSMIFGGILLPVRQLVKLVR